MPRCRYCSSAYKPAREVAAEIGLLWRKVAFALRRLEKRGYVDQEIVEVFE